MKYNLTTLVFLASMTLAGQAHANSKLYEQTLRSVVCLRNAQEQSSGSGAVIDAEQRLIVTNYHVVGQADELQVMFPQFEASGRLIAEASYYERTRPVVTGRVLARDPKRDLALVQIDSLPDGVRALPLASHSVKPGEQIHSIGNPGASDAMWVYTSGTVRQVYQACIPCDGGLLLDARVIETQSPVNRGDSGGPAVSEFGELVGVVQSYNPEARDMSVFVDITEVKDLLRDGPKPLHDPAVAEKLTACGVEYVVDEDGDFCVDFASIDGETTVLVTAVGSPVPSLNLLHLYSTVYVGRSQPSVLALASLLRRSEEFPLGKCELFEADGDIVVLFSAQLPRHRSPEELAAVVEMVGRATLSMRRTMSDAQ